MKRPKEACVDCWGVFIQWGCDLGEWKLSRPRNAPHPGPRCATHHRVVVKARKEKAHGSRVAKVYGLTPAGYAKLLELQGGVCAICKKPSRVRRLAVDHDHSRENEFRGGVRGLLDRRCNHDLLGFFGVEELQAAIDYLTDPPASHLADEYFLPKDDDDV